MRKILIVIALFAICAGNAVAQKVELKTQMDSVSYVLGLQFGDNIAKDDLDFNLDAFNAGMKDGMNKVPEEKRALNKEQIRTVMMGFQAIMQQKQQEQQKLEQEKKMKAAEDNKKKGAAFLEENKKKEGVKVTESGLQYKVVKEGTGKKPTAENKVKVHYKGTLINGKKFDSSYDRNQPLEFNLGGVIKGWTEGLQLMKEGAKFVFYIPSELAYGERGAGRDIGPNEVLIFEVELLEVK